MTRIALITGGAGGLGLASARALAVAGHRVAICDLDGAGARRAAETLPGTGHAGLALDVTSESAVRDVFDRVEAELGPVAVLATFAGLLVGTGPKARIADTATEDWERTFAVNARGTFFCVREMLRRRRAAPVAQARIVTVGSVAAQVGGVRGNAAYSAAKGAVHTLTKSAAAEGAAFGVTANCIAPGMIATPMLRQVLPIEDEAAGAAAAVPLARVGRPEEIAGLVAYLASPASEFMTGATLDMNGGQYLR